MKFTNLCTKTFLTICLQMVAEIDLCCYSFGLVTSIFTELKCVGVKWSLRFLETTAEYVLFSRLGENIMFIVHVTNLL